ncbi:MAG: heme-binding domain-containing protein [Cyclobacteriaceae bacterium]|nr:heme-binding domain-containing protein [Cyclobacteriaceae bacterium]
MTRKILIGLLVALILIQFIRPTRNISTGENPNEISKHYAVPEQVHKVLVYSCYDCHSNNTKYPWYTNIQPVGLWLQSHVEDGKRHLNFDEFGTYPEKKAKHKFEEIEETTKTEWMPLESYLIIHGDAKLTKEQWEEMRVWASSLK